MNTLSIVTALAVLAAPTSGPLPTAPKQAAMQNCQVFLIQDLEVPALESGPLTALNVKEGDLVHQDEVLAQIDDRQAQLTRQSVELERDAARAKADDDIDVRYAIKSHELADAELNQDLEIKRKSPGAISDAEIRRKQLMKTREQLGIDRAKLDRRISEITANVKSTALEAADETILRRKILAPFNGIVVDVSKHSSEWVNAGEAVVRVANMDRLRVEGFLSASEFNPTEIVRRQVVVEVELARGRREQFEGEVVWVSQLMQAGNKFRVRAEVANRMERDEPLLRPGMTTRMTVFLQ